MSLTSHASFIRVERDKDRHCRRMTASAITSNSVDTDGEVEATWAPTAAENLPATRCVGFEQLVQTVEAVALE
jgi:hypothetical protein